MKLPSLKNNLEYKSLMFTYSEVPNDLLILDAKQYNSKYILHFNYV